MHSEIIQRDPADLKPLSEIKNFPRWNREDPRFLGLCDDIRMNGIRHPLQITDDNHVVDGETRRLVARFLQLAHVPCVIVPDNEVDDIIIRELIRRRNLTKGQLAFLVCPHLEKAFEESRRRQLEKLRKAKQTPDSDSVGNGKSIKEYVTLMGFSEDLLDQARYLHDIFARDKTKRTLTDNEGHTEQDVTFEEFFKPRIFQDHKPYGLGAVRAGISYLLQVEQNPHLRKGGKPKESITQLKLFNHVRDDELIRWEYWQNFGEEEKSQHWQHVRSKVSALPKAQCEELADYHAKLAAEFRKSAKREEE